MPDYTAIMSTSFAEKYTEFVSFLCKRASGFFHTVSKKGDEHSVSDGNSERDLSTGQRVYFADTEDEILDFDRDDESEGAIESEDGEVGSKDDDMETDKDDSFAENGFKKGDYHDIDAMRKNVEILLTSFLVQQSDFSKQRKNFENIFNGATVKTEISATDKQKKQIAAEPLQYFWLLYVSHCEFESTSSTSQAPILDKDAIERWQLHRKEVSTGASS